MFHFDIYRFFLIALLPLFLFSCGSGSSSDADDVETRTRIMSWHVPQSASQYLSFSGQSVTKAKVGLDDSGRGVAAWVQFNGSHYQLYKSEFKSKSWSKPQGLSDSVSIQGQNVKEFDLAVAKAGPAILVWVQSDGSYDRVYKSEYRSGKWTQPTSLSQAISPTGATASRAAAAIDDNGNVVVVWASDSGFFSHLLKSEYRNGKWTHPTLAMQFNPSGTNAFNPEVAMSANGAALITWTQDSGSGEYLIYKSEYRNGAWVHPSNLSQYIQPPGSSSTFGFAEPQVALDGRGNGLIVWAGNDGNTEQIYMSEYRNKIWNHPSSLSDHVSPTGSYAYSPSAAMGDDGSAVVVWSQQDSMAQTKIFISEYRNGQWNHPSSNADTFSGFADVATTLHSIAMNENGETIVAWNHSDGTAERIYRATFAGQNWTKPQNANDYVSLSHSAADRSVVAINNIGEKLIFWLQADDNAPIQLYSSEYY